MVALVVDAFVCFVCFVDLILFWGVFCACGCWCVLSDVIYCCYVCSFLCVMCDLLFLL